eukprot:COSAG06_NODE_68143_length_238_cov_12.258993_1_plen_51_part_10
MPAGVVTLHSGRVILKKKKGVRTCCSGEGGIGSGEEVGEAPLPAPFNVKCD